MELVINGKTYQFKFNMGFMREINKKIVAPVPDLKGVTKEMGLQYKVAGLIDGDVEDLIEILHVANKGCDPRVTVAELDAYIDEECTDIDALFAEVMDFLRSANATRKTVAALEKRAAEMMEQQKQN
jgi:hypothetical protein